MPNFLSEKVNPSFVFQYDSRVPPLQTPVKTRTPFSPNELLCSSPPDTLLLYDADKTSYQQRAKFDLKNWNNNLMLLLGITLAP